jgi:hypothetical protein
MRNWPLTEGVVSIFKMDWLMYLSCCFRASVGAQQNPVESGSTLVQTPSFKTIFMIRHIDYLEAMGPPFKDN